MIELTGRGERGNRGASSRAVAGGSCKRSTDLHERVGDLVAVDLVQAPYTALQEIVAQQAGAVVRTIGGAVTPTFTTPERALSAAPLRTRSAMVEVNRKESSEGLYPSSASVAICEIP